MQTRNHVPSLLGALVFILAALFLFGIAFVMGVGVLTSLFMETGIQSEQTVLLVAFGFEALVLAAAAYFSFQKFLQKPGADQELSIPMSNGWIAVLALVAGLSILLGYQISKAETIDWLILPILTIPAAVLPLGVLLAFATRKLPFGTRWQTWNALGLGMSLTPLILFFLEAFVALVILFVVVVYVVAQPELASELEELSRQMMLLGPNSEAALELLSPLLTKPAVIATALIYMAVLVPAIEEIFKPLGVWLLAGKLGSQAQGFALGALSGAGYGLIETIGVSGQTADWANLLLTRIGTGLLHITTSALVGGAIVVAWRERRYLYFLGTYLFAVLLHGLWNTSAILFSFSTMAKMLDQQAGLGAIQPMMIAALAILAIGLFAILILANRKMRTTVPSAPAQSEVPAVSVDVGDINEIPLVRENTELPPPPEALPEEK